MPHDSTLDALLAAAVEIADERERQAYIERACAGEAPRLAELQALVRDHFAAGSLLDRPAAYLPTLDMPAPLEAVGTMIGPYKLLEQIGEGGMGVVYLAEQKTPVRRSVALKIIKPGMDTLQVIARFESERQALAMMDHPNIAKVLDAGATASGRPYFVMELVKGTPLTAFCNEKRLTVRDRLNLMIPVCQAIQHAHQKGIIHRDIKPTNVIVALYDGHPIPKVIDFGVAKATGHKLTDHTMFTALGQIVGTPMYMSPEQAEPTNVDVDTRSDVYSLGVLLYELLTGTTPFDRVRLRTAAWDEMLRIIRDEEPSKPSLRLSEIESQQARHSLANKVDRPAMATVSLASVAAQRQTEPAKLSREIRGELDWVVMKALEKDRSRRYASAGELARDVERHLQDQPVEAGPPSTAYRWKKFVMRNRTAVLAGAAVAAALLVGLSAAAWQAVRATRAEGIALAERDDAEQSRQAAEAGRRQARRAQEQAMDALRGMTDEVIENLIGSKTGLGATEKAFLEKAIQRWEAFAANTQNDALERTVRADGLFSVSRLRSMLGQNEEAEDGYRQAVELLERLADEFPTLPEYRRNLAKVRANLGFVLVEIGKFDEAEAVYRRALDGFSALARDLPREPEFRAGLAHCHTNLGVFLLGQGRVDEAAIHFRPALDILSVLAAESPAVAAYQAELAMYHTNLGLVSSAADKEAHYGMAIDILEKLAADFPDAPAYRLNLAKTRGNLAVLYSNLGKYDDEKRQLGKAADISRALAAEFPGSPVYPAELGASLLRLSASIWEMGERQEALVQNRQALEIASKLAADYPTVLEYRNLLQEAHNDLGVFFTELGQPNEAEQHCRQAVEIGARLAAEYPGVPSYRVSLGGAYCNFGQLCVESGQPEQGLDLLSKAVAILDPLVAAAPEDADARRFLRNSVSERARALCMLQRAAEAIADCDRAVELSPPAEQPGERINRLAVLVLAGQIGRALVEADELTQLPGWNADQLYNLACVYSLASDADKDRQDEHAKRAVELLGQAIANGWLDVAQLTEDPDLNPLRERQDFAELLAGLQKATPAPAESQPGLPDAVAPPPAAGTP